jgi:hypothetical protein
MAVAALIISILALAVALASTAYTRKQASEAERIRIIEDARRHEERQPVLRGWIESVNGGGWHRLWLQLESSEPLSRLKAEITADVGVLFTPSQTGVDHRGYSNNAAWDRPLDTGACACWRVELAEDRAERLQLRVTCSRGEDLWTVLVVVDVPYDVARSIL